MNERGAKQLLPWTSLIMSIVILPFVGTLAFGSIGTGLLALVYVQWKFRNTAT